MTDWIYVQQTDCAAAEGISVAVSLRTCPQDPELSEFVPANVPTDLSPTITVKETAQGAYTYLEHAARRFARCITVTASVMIRSAVRAFRRVVCEAKALFNRRVFFFAGGLRL